MLYKIALSPSDRNLLRDSRQSQRHLLDIFRYPLQTRRNLALHLIADAVEHPFKKPFRGLIPLHYQVRPLVSQADQIESSVFGIKFSFDQ